MRNSYHISILSCFPFSYDHQIGKNQKKFSRQLGNSRINSHYLSLAVNSLNHVFPPYLTFEIFASAILRGENFVTPYKLDHIRGYLMLAETITVIMNRDTVSLLDHLNSDAAPP